MLTVVIIRREAAKGCPLGDIVWHVLSADYPREAGSENPPASRPAQQASTYG